MYRKAKSVSRWGRVGVLLHVLIINPNYTRTYHNLSWLCYLTLFYEVRVFIYPKSFVCLFVCSFLHFFGYFF